MQESLNQPKVALITGAARRVGAAIACRLHRAGWNVVLHCHASKQEALDLAAKLNAARAHSAVVCEALLGKPATAAKLVAEAVAAWGRLDALVNNASRFYPTPVGQTEESAWDDLFDSNVKAPYFLAEAAVLPLNQTEGVIINIVDTHSEFPLGGYGVYCLTKAALAMMTRVLAKELAPRIRVNGVSPGSVVWPEGENTLSSEAKDKIINGTLLKRHGSAEEIAGAVHYFVCEAPFVTGQILAVDGGRHI